MGGENRRSGQLNGTKRTGIGMGVSPYTAGSRGFDGLLVIRPDGKVQIHQGLGNLGTNSNFDTARAAADVLGVEWDDVEVVWGDTSRHLPWSAVQAGSQSTHAHTRANHAVGLDARQKLQEIAARDLGGRPEDYETSDGRVYRRSNPSQGMTLGRAATRAIELGGRYSGEEFNDDLNDMTKASVTGLAGQGLVAAARDNFGGEGGLQSWVVGFAEVELDVETGKVDVLHFTATTDCGVVVHPRGLGGQIFGGSFQGMGIAMSQKWVFDPGVGRIVRQTPLHSSTAGNARRSDRRAVGGGGDPGPTDPGRRQRDRRTLCGSRFSGAYVGDRRCLGRNVFVPDTADTGRPACRN